MLYAPITSFFFLHLMHFFTKRTGPFQTYGIITMHHCLPTKKKSLGCIMSKLRNEIMPFFPGIRDENNNTYNPKIVRIGVKAHHSVKAVSMDYLVHDLICKAFSV